MTTGLISTVNVVGGAFCPGHGVLDSRTETRNTVKTIKPMRTCKSIIGLNIRQPAVFGEAT